MRVLWVTKGLGPGGAERLLVAGATCRAPDVDAECAYVLPWKDHLAGALESAGVVTQCMSTRRRDPMWPMRLVRLVRSGGFDVVHVHSPLPGSVARLGARSMRRGERPAVVATEHNTWRTHRLPTRLLNRWTSRWNDASLAVTDEVRESMAGRGARDTVTLRHGIDVDAVRAASADRDRIRSEFGLAASTIAIGTVANFREQKDYPNLLAAASILRDRAVPVRCIAVGQGPLEGEMRQRCRDMGLEGFVTFTGFRDDATSVMAACDVFTLASQWEGLPVAVMEATALGLPLVVTDVGGVAEEFTNDEDALLVPPGEPAALAAALSLVVTSAGVRDRLGRASAARASDFDSARAVPQVERVYRRLAGDPGTQDVDVSTAPATPPAARRPPALAIRPAVPGDRDAILAVMRRSLGSDDDPRYPQMFAWKHDQNPFGASPMWLAVDGDRVAAVRAFMRWEFVRGGRVVRAVRAVDTATDPDDQGKGLFTALTLHGLDALHDEGIDLVFNTPNSKSRPGYLKMGWRMVGKVPAVARFNGASGLRAAATSRIGAQRWSEPLTVGEPVDAWIADGRAGAWLASEVKRERDVRALRTRLDEQVLSWRFGGDLLGYRVVDDGRSAVVMRMRRRGTAGELAVVGVFGDRRHADRLATAASIEAGADYALRLGAADPRTGYLPLPGGGPMLTWRSLADRGQPPRSNWMLELGDIELF